MKRAHIGFGRVVVVALRPPRKRSAGRLKRQLCFANLLATEEPRERNAGFPTGANLFRSTRRLESRRYRRVAHQNLGCATEGGAARRRATSSTTCFPSSLRESERRTARQSLSPEPFLNLRHDFLERPPHPMPDQIDLGAVTAHHARHLLHRPFLQRKQMEYLVMLRLDL